jgi:hypothetical protein
MSYPLPNWPSHDVQNEELLQLAHCTGQSGGDVKFSDSYQNTQIIP